MKYVGTATSVSDIKEGEIIIVEADTNEKTWGRPAEYGDLHNQQSNLNERIKQFEEMVVVLKKEVELNQVKMDKLKIILMKK